MSHFTRAALAVQSEPHEDVLCSPLPTTHYRNLISGIPGVFPQPIELPKPHNQISLPKQACPDGCFRPYSDSSEESGDPTIRAGQVGLGDHIALLVLSTSNC